MLLVVYRSSLTKYLLKSFAHFFNGFSLKIFNELACRYFLSLLSFEEQFYILMKSSLWVVFPLSVFAFCVLRNHCLAQSQIFSPVFFSEVV